MKLRKLLGRILLASTVFIVLMLLAGAAFQRWREYRLTGDFEPPGRLVDVGGYSLHLLCQGQGAPTVVVDPGGYGGSTQYAAGLSEALAPHHRVCVYDPPGQGWSESGPNPGAVPERFRAFRSMIERSKIEGAFVLVAESSGAHVARLFVSARPSRVAGLVLVDPAFDDLERERRHWQPEERARAARLRKLARLVPLLAQFGLHRPLLGPAVKDATEGLPAEIRPLVREQALSRKSVRLLVARTLQRESGLSEVREAALPPRLPLYVLTAEGAPEDAGSPYQAEKRAYHRELARLTERGLHELVQETSHAMLRDRPERVAEAVRSVAAMADRVEGAARAVSSEPGDEGTWRVVLPETARPSRP